MVIRSRPIPTPVILSAIALAGLISGPLLLGTVRAYVIPPEPLLDFGVGGGVEALTGDWTGAISGCRSQSGPVTRLVLSLRQGARSAESPHSLSLTVAELENLTAEQMVGTPREVNFELVRDAGVLRFAGRFESGEGTGHWSFAPSADYLVGMRSLGYSGIDLQRAYTLTALDVSRRLVQDLAELGYRGVALEQLVAMRVHGITPDLVRRANNGTKGAVPVGRLLDLRMQAGGAQ